MRFPIWAGCYYKPPDPQWLRFHHVQQLIVSTGPQSIQIRLTMEEDETTETTRLLNNPSREDSKPSALRSIVAAFTIHLLLNIATFLALTPQTAILQDIVCKKYYDQPNTRNETIRDCSIEPVQGEVAYVIGWETAIENIPSMPVSCSQIHQISSHGNSNF